MAEQALGQEQNRAYFLFDLFNKLAVNVPGVQKYLRLTTTSIEQFCEIQTAKQVLGLFNWRNVVDLFGKFTSIWFKVVQNCICAPTVHAFMTKLWGLILGKMQEASVKGECPSPQFGRK